ncbi:MAG TPA: hypothetical protein DCP28_13790, partial [Cytophagales bacterium]|nr:hypothetical protein [Cytophagales bacterium]
MSTLEIILLLLSLIALLLSGIAFLQTRNRKARNMPLNELPQILNQHYLERSLSQTDFDGQSYSDVKSLKHTTLAKHGYGQSKTWPEVLESFHPTSTESAQENTLAYTLSMGMEHVGMLLTSGAIPLLPTFQLAGVQLAA